MNLLFINNLITNDVVKRNINQAITTYQMNTNVHNSVNNLLHLMILVSAVIVVMIIIRKLYMKYTISGRLYAQNLKDKKQKIDSISLLYNVANDTDDQMVSASKETSKYTNSLSNRMIKIKPIIKFVRPFKCKFRVNEGLEFISANDNFYKLYNVTNKNEFARHYYYVSQTKNGKVVPSIPKDSIKNLLHKKIDPSKNYAIGLYDIFDIPAKDFSVITDIIKSKSYLNNEDKIVISGTMDLKDLAQYINITVSYDISIRSETDDNNEDIVVLLVAFNIKTITPRINHDIDLSIFNNYNYKQVIRNTILNLKIPMFFINKKGISFINKCTYDWLDLPYNNINNDVIDVNETKFIINKIDPEIMQVIENMVSGNTKLKTFYKEVVLDKKIKDIDDSIHMKESSKSVIIHIEPFEDDKGEIHIMCCLTDSYPIHKYIIHNEENCILLKLSEDSNTKDITEVQFIGNTFTMKKYNYSSEILQHNQENNPPMVTDKDLLKLINNSEIITYVNELNDKYHILKSFFTNTDMISFGRIHLKSKEIIACNDSFEELLRFDDNKDSYITIINKIISSVSDHNNIVNGQSNLYCYNIHYKTHQLKVLFTYNQTNNTVDIVFLDKQNRRFFSNDSMDFLDSLYETSDLPIVVVDKKCDIIKSNTIFKKMFFNDGADVINNKISLLSLVPDVDKRKIHRAISSAIKFNSVNHNDTIRMITKDGITNECIFKCIKSYSKIGETEIVTITIFPINNNIKIVKKGEDAVDASN